jgi:hypothetical protein
LSLAATSAPQSATATPLPRAVLIIDEADPSSGTPTTFSSTLRESLNKVQPHIVVYGETLDLSQFSESRQEEILRTYVQEKYRDAGVGLVIELVCLPLSSSIAGAQSSGQESPWSSGQLMRLVRLILGSTVIQLA